MLFHLSLPTISLSTTILTPICIRTPFADSPGFTSVMDIEALLELPL